MKLDKRIKDISTIQTILRNDVSIGSKGYFFDEFVDTKDLSRCCRYGELIEVDFGRDQNDLCFKAKLENGNTNFFRFFISEADLKPIEKKYRPYSLEEFLEIFGMGDLIYFKGKGCCDDEVKVAMFTGYITDVERIDDKTPGACEVMLGVFHYSLFSLFEDFERFYNGKWWPFGVLVEDEL